MGRNSRGQSTSGAWSHPAKGRSPRGGFHVRAGDPRKAKTLTNQRLDIEASAANLFLGETLVKYGVKHRVVSSHISPSCPGPK
jgi:hypothetical protein